MNIKDTFCILPFTHLATHPTGDITPCCESKLKAKTGNIELKLGYNSLEEIRNSDSFKELREAMLSGKKHSACSFCYRREEAALESKRNRENKYYEVDWDKIDTYKTLPLYSVELRLGNVCNAKCIICNPFSSSKWNEDITPDMSDVYDEGYKKVILKNKWYKDIDFYSSILSQIDQVKYIWFNGGEPLLIKEHLVFLQQIIDNKKEKTIELEYHTNGSLISTKIIEIWKKFKFIKVTLSLDDIHSRFNYSRYPLSFSEALNSINLLEKNNIHYDIIPTINLLNVYNMEEIYQFYKQQFNKECKFNYLRFPSFQSIVNLPEDEKKYIESNTELPYNIHTQLSYELNREEGIGISKAYDFYRSLDRKRNTDLIQELPEWLNLKTKYCEKIPF